MRNDITPGNPFPDYELPDHTGTSRKLSTLQGDDPMVLTLHRGLFCPKDRQQLHQLVPFHDECVVGYTRLVSTTTDNDLIEISELRQGVGAHWPFMYDAERVIADDLEIHEYTDEKHRPMIPYTFVLAPGLEIRKVYPGYWYWGRPSIAELREDLRTITREIRPDWKIDSPNMRRKWEAGEKESFFPYGRSMEAALARANGVLDRRPGS
jgi:peroxiredoxin